MLFLLIFTGYWIVFWQQYISLPGFIHTYIDPNARVERIIVLALGEIIQAPRYYEYIAKLAPAEQQGTYMGFAFLPIGIGSLIGGWLGGRVIHQFAEVAHQPQRAWWVISGVGLLTALLLWVYDRIVKPSAPQG